jgi:hypothetical protein
MKCSKCNKNVRTMETHKCVRDLAQLPQEAMLELLYKSGGCGKEYYENELLKLKAK